MFTNARNIAIVLLIAAAIWGLPGGGDVAEVALATLSAAFLCLIVFVAMRLYRDHRVAIYALGDLNRAILYTSIGAIVVATAALAAKRLEDAYVLIWVFVVGVAVLGLYRVWRHHRDYSY